MDAWGGRGDAADAGFATGVVGFSDAWDGGGGEVLVWQIAVISLVAVLASGSALVRRCAWQFGGDTHGVLGAWDRGAAGDVSFATDEVGF